MHPLFIPKESAFTPIACSWPWSDLRTVLPDLIMGRDKVCEEIEIIKINRDEGIKSSYFTFFIVSLTMNVLLCKMYIGLLYVIYFYIQIVVK